jgi:two-component system response regulator FixJ
MDRIAQLKRQAADADSKLTRLYAAIEDGVADPKDENLKGRPVEAQDALSERFARLTPRQVEIFDLVVEGFTSFAISAKLQISVRTVESYRAEVMEKMRAESVAVLVRQAIRLGRITP